MAERRPFGQEASDFHIWIDARVEPTKQLQDEPVAIDDRRVALFRLEDARRKSLGTRAAQPIEALRGEGAHRTDGTRQMTALLDQPEQRSSELRIDHGIVDERTTRASGRAEIDVAHHSLGRLRANLLSPCAARHGQWQQVDLRVTIRVFHIDQAKTWPVGEIRHSHDISEASRIDALRLPAKPPTAS